MAKSSSFFGLRTGSTKSHTYQVLRGTQITKDRVTKVANPQSTAQMAQRLKLPIVTANRQILKELVNHSFEGTSYGDASLRKFAQLNLASGNLAIKEYVPKGISNTGVANLEISRGSLLPNTVAYMPLDSTINAPTGVNSDAKKFFAFSLRGTGRVAANTTYTEGNLAKMDAAQFKAIMDALGLGENEQLTWLILYRTDSTFDFTGESGDQQGYYNRYVVSRIVNKQEQCAQWTATAQESAVIITDGYINIYIAMSDTTIANPYGVCSIAGSTTPDILAATVISSAKDSDSNSWKRSPQRLVVNSNVESYIDFNEAESTYLKTQAESDKYLNTGLTGVGISGGTQADVNAAVSE